jgi:ribosomal protein S18 acetylase RimI-like enzyme
MIKITLLNVDNEIDMICSLLQESFKTVAEEYKLTKENSPTHNAFITQQILQKEIEKGVILFGFRDNDKLIGCVGINKASNKDCYYIEKLCVLPAYRHKRIGNLLLAHAITEIAKKKCNYISIGIINENEQLKQWYINQGFIEQKFVKFDHQSFTVCFLTMHIITLQQLSDDYIPLVKTWLNKKYISKWFSEPEEWLNEIKLRNTDFSFINHFIAFHNGKPIGFCQYYAIDASNEDDYKTYRHTNTYSIDYAIGEEDYLERAFGKLLIQELCTKIFNDENGCLVVVKPEKENIKSCKTLLSVGFVYDHQTEVYVLRKKRLTTAST